MKKTRVVLDTNVDKRAKRADMSAFMRVMKKVKARPPVSGDAI